MKNHLLNFLQCLATFCYLTQFNAQGSPLLELISPGQDSTLKWIELEGRPGKPKIVFISGDEEYRSEESLVQLAKILNVNHGF